MEFEYISNWNQLIWYILAAWLATGLLFAFYMVTRKMAIRKFAHLKAIQRLAPWSSSGKQWLKFILILLAAGFMITGIADPKTGSKIEIVEQSGIDLYIALDLSKSMLAEDVTPNRLGVAKQFTSRLIEGLEGSRIGLILFAGNAYKQVPLTLNHISTLTDLNAADTDYIPSQGTAIGDAVRIAIDAFALENDPESGEINSSSQVLLVISDGEDHEGDTEAQIAEAVENGITVYTAGIGSEGGAPIPIKDKYGNVQYKKDADENIVLTKLNVGMMEGLAKKGNGKYVGISSSLNADELLADFKEMEGGVREEKVFTEHEDQFQWFLLPAFILLLVEFLFGEGSNQLLKRLNLFGGKND